MFQIDCNFDNNSENNVDRLDKILSFGSGKADEIWDIPPIEERYYDESDLPVKSKCVDNRTHPIHPTYRANITVLPICYIRIRFGDKYYRASGFKITNKLILTSAHCVYDAVKKVYADSITVYQALHDTNKTPYGGVYSKRFFKSRYYEEKHSPHDIGAILIPGAGLDSPNFNMWLPSHFDNDKKEEKYGFTSRYIVRCGYPSDKSREGMTSSIDELHKEDNYRQYYIGTEFGGASGSPIYFRKPGSSNVYFANAIVNGKYVNLCENYATKIAPHSNELLQWVLTSSCLY